MNYSIYYNYIILVQSILAFLSNIVIIVIFSKKLISVISRVWANTDNSISPNFSGDWLEISCCRELRCILKEYTPHLYTPLSPQSLKSRISRRGGFLVGWLVFNQVTATPYATFEPFSESLMSQDKLTNFHMGKLKEHLHHSSRTLLIHCSSQIYVYLTTLIERSDPTIEKYFENPWTQIIFWPIPASFLMVLSK